MRLALLISKRLRRSRPFGWPVVTFQSPDQLGLITRSGIVVDPRPFRDWRGRPNRRRWTAPVSRVRENRTHGSMRRGWNGADLTRSTGVAPSPGKPAAMKAQVLPSVGHRASPRHDP